MQSGQYHSFGEVLGGLQCASLNFGKEKYINNIDNPRNDVNEFKEKFCVLCDILAHTPEDFALFNLLYIFIRDWAQSPKYQRKINKINI